MTQNNDTISRQAAIDAFYEMASDIDHLCTVGDYVHVLEGLPSAQPEMDCQKCIFCGFAGFKQFQTAQSKTEERLAETAQNVPKDDLISRKAAIDVLEERLHANGYSNVALVSELNRSIGYLMRLPSAQPEKRTENARKTHECDLIDRSAAITAIQKAYADTEGGTDKCAVWKNVGLTNALHIMQDLPSAQPEIVQCKDCRYAEHWYRDKARCFLWHETGIDVYEDGFCNYAKRRTDE